MINPLRKRFAIEEKPKVTRIYFLDVPAVQRYCRNGFRYGPLKGRI